MSALSSATRMRSAGFSGATVAAKPWYLTAAGSSEKALAGLDHATPLWRFARPRRRALDDRAESRSPRLPHWRRSRRKPGSDHRHDRQRRRELVTHRNLAEPRRADASRTDQRTTQRDGKAALDQTAQNHACATEIHRLPAFTGKRRGVGAGVRFWLRRLVAARKSEAAPGSPSREP